MNIVQRLASVREQTLDRLIRVGLVVVAIGIVLVGIVYYLDQHAGSGPTLIERRTTAAEDAVRKTPNNVGFRIQLAEIYRTANKPDSALAQYDAVLKVDSGQRAALLGRAELLEAKGNFVEATSSYKKVIGKSGGEEFSSIDPQLASAYYGLGSIALRQNRTKDAILAFDKAVRIEPTDSDTLYLLGVASLKAGDPRRAVNALRRAVLFVPTGWCEPYQQLTEAYKALNRKDYAEYAGAMVDFCMKKTDKAKSRLKPLTKGPASIDAMLGLGMVAEAQSDRAGAIRWYRKVVASDAANLTARSGLSRLGVTKSSGSKQPSVPADHPSSAGSN